MSVGEIQFTIHHERGPYGSFENLVDILHVMDLKCLGSDGILFHTVLLLPAWAEVSGSS